jgi:hypothetical protein
MPHNHAPASKQRIADGSTSLQGGHGVRMRRCGRRQMQQTAEFARTTAGQNKVVMRDA